MRIGFDISQTAERMAGCGVFADELCGHLSTPGRIKHSFHTRSLPDIAIRPSPRQPERPTILRSDQDFGRKAP